MASVIAFITLPFDQTKRFQVIQRVFHGGARKAGFLGYIVEADLCCGLMPSEGATADEDHNSIFGVV
jgi:hypothetical protein